MKLSVKTFWVLTFVYIISSSFFYLQTAFHQRVSLRFLYPDVETVLRVQAVEGQYDAKFGETVSRFFYNKPFAYVQTYVDSLYRSTDLSFLFGLTTSSSMYDDQGKIDMLLPIELPFFLLSIFTLLRSSNKKYRWLFILFCLSVFIPAFFLPSLEKIKLFPEVLIIRCSIVFGVYEGAKKWLKK